MPKRKPLEDWQLDDAKRLKALYEARAGLSQLAFGAEFDLGTQGMVWQYLNGHTPLNLSAAIRFAQGLKCTVGEFSPTLAQDLDRLAEAASPEVGQSVAVYNTDEKTLLAGFRVASPDRMEDMLDAAKRALESASPLENGGTQ